MQLSQLSQGAPTPRNVITPLVRATLFLLIALGSGLTSAQAKTPLGRKWSPSQQVSMDQIDHSAFDSLLHKYVDADGYVNYRAWKASAADRKALNNFIVQLSRATTRRRSGRNAQMAFWINAYNAVTLEGILQEFPTTSIRNHTSKLGYNIWKHLPLLVDGRLHSLENIENKVLRPMREPRIHFAIVCASVGCPRLKNEAYTADNLQQQLADNTRDFFSRSQNLQVDSARRTLHLSSILKWYGKDFGRTNADRLSYLRPYLPATARQVASQGASIRFLKYNWNLNDQSRKPRTASRR
ncbi:MAG: DUF547 domain-containing protein [Planctomycetaceae bacterium]|jgi:hypothetical protein|nr:DUF547 domain-containing protein [Planctomycetaceae bacterium]MBT6154244.1 DUF547 domain-containing protein [Planctomycetaceae bacterium]MBT6485658.1 DUF547 domain-containing protein [Planctomycetaceae bacterium]MBT6497440.1 DUF547 domain-containing protein [Planctomycetaceae bacterium]